MHTAFPRVGKAKPQQKSRTRTQEQSHMLTAAHECVRTHTHAPAHTDECSRTHVHRLRYKRELPSAVRAQVNG